ncbi:MAG: TldD/PmbA family protein [Candidatus Brocadiales bacterium]|nr:TldD/PmbA family protein [Candidatus Bathyanammoxibius amoris]
MTIEEQVLELAKKKADSAEVIFEQGESKSVSFENNKLKYITSNSVKGIGLRVIKEGRIGFTTTTDLGDPERLVGKAVRSAKFGQEAQFEFPCQSAFSEIKIFDKAVVDYPTEDAISGGKEAIEKSLAVCPEYLCGVDIGTTVWKRRLLNSNGLDVSKASTSFGTGYNVMLMKDKGLIAISEGEGSRKITTGLMGHVAKSLEKMRLSEKEVRVPPGKYPVIFAAKNMSLLLATFEMGCSGKLVQKGISPLAGKLGEKLLDERVSIYDDATIDFATGSYPLDGEGTPSQRTPLFEKGVLKNFLFDLQTAGIMSTKTTGSGSRGFTSQPSPGCTNVIVETGDMKLEDMIKDIRYGVLVDQVLGGGQSNMLAGEFSVNIDLGFLIENGEFVGRVKDCMIAGNVFDTFNNIIAIGSEAEWHGSDLIPPFYFKDLRIIGQEG